MDTTSRVTGPVLVVVLVVAALAGGPTAPVIATNASPPAPAAGPGGPGPQTTADAAAGTVTVTLTVNESDGTPAANDTVTWRNDVTDTETTGTTNASGTASVTLQVGADYRVSYVQNGTGAPADDGSPDAYALGTRSYDADTTEGATLPPAHDLTIGVVNESGDPVPDARVFAVHHANAAASTGRVGVDASGTHTFEMAGDVQASANPPDASTLSSNFTHVTVNDTTVVELTLRETVRFDGSVAAPNGSRLSNVTLRLHTVGSASHDRQETTDDRGLFSTRVVENGSYTNPVWQGDLRSYPVVFPRDDVADFWVPEPLNASTNTTRNYSLPVGHNLTVTVENRTGAPVENAAVQVSQTSGPAFGSVYAYRHQPGPATDAEGRMVHDPNGVPGLELNGTYELTVHPPDGSGYAVNETTVTVASDRTHTVVLHPDGDGGDGSGDPEITVSGTVRYENGTAVPNASVRVVTPDRSDERWAVANDSGRYSVQVDPARTYKLGVYQVNATDPGASFPRDGVADFDFRGPLDVSSGPVTRDLTLPDGHPVNVTVVNRSGDPATDATIRLWDYIGFGMNAHAFAGDDLPVNDQGMLEHPPNGIPGFELAGDLEVHADPPSEAYLGNTSNVDVTGPANLTLALHPAVNVSGTISLPNGTPAANTTISWERMQGPWHAPHDVTDAQGRYDLRIAANVSYDKQVRPVDHTDPPYVYPRDNVADAVSFQPTTHPSDVVRNFTIPYGHPFNVSVVNASGQPVEDAIVRASHRNGSANARVDGFIGGVPTNAQGLMEHAPNGLPGWEMNGTVGVSVEPPAGSGYQPNGTLVNVTGPTTATVVLHGPADRVAVSGTVEYPNGTVAENATVRVANLDGSFDQRIAVTNAAGEYSLSVLPDRPYKVGVYQANVTAGSPVFPRDGVADFANRGLLTASGPVTRNLTLPDGHPVNVTILNRSGDPATDAAVRFHVRNGSQGLHVATFAGDDRFPVNPDGLLEHPPNDRPGLELSGEAQVTALPPSAASLQNHTQITATGPTDVTLTLHPAANVSGTVRHPDGSVAANATVRWGGVNGTGVSAHAVTDSLGRYQARVAANGTYGMQVWQVDHSDPPYRFPRDGVADAAAYGPTTVTGDLTRNVTLPVGHPFNVSVVNESGGPVADAVVRPAHRNGSIPARVDGFIHGVPTRADGLMVHGPNGVPGFELNGTVGVEVSPPAGTGYGGNATEATVTGPTTETVVLPGSGSIVNVSGLVTYPNGSAAPGVTVRWETADGATHGTQAVTAADGSYAATLHPNESYRVWVWQGDLRVANVDAPTEITYPRDGVADFAALGWLNTSTADETRDYSMPAGHVLDVTVENESGAGVENASVGLAHEVDGVVAHVYSYLHVHGVPTDAAGRMHHPPNPTPGLEVAGTVEVHVRPPDGTAYTPNGTTVTVSGPEQVALTLQKRYTLAGRWVGPDGTPVGEAAGYVGNFSTGVFVPASTDPGGNFTATVPAGTYDIWVLPRDPDDGLADAWTVQDAHLDADTDLGNLTLPHGYDTAVEVRDREDRLVDAATRVDGANGGYQFLLQSGRNLTVDPTNVRAVHELADGMKPAVVYDEWTHDVLAERIITVTDQVETVVLTVDRFDGTRISGASGVTVARDLETTTGDGTVGDLLNTSVNVRLFVLNSTAGTHTHVREAFPAGYGLDGTVAENVTYDGNGHIENVTDEGGALAFDVVGSVTEVRYRVSPNATPSSAIRFGGQFGANATPVVGQDSLPGEANVSVFAPANGTLFGPNATVEYVTRHPDAGNATGVEYRLDGEDWQAVGGTPAVGAIDLAGLSDGSHTVAVRLADAGGSTVAADSVGFEVDATAPTVAVDPAFAGNVSANNPVAIDLTRVDAHPATAVLTVENGSGTVYSRNLTGEFAGGSATATWNATTDGGTPVASGDYAVRLAATDATGNANETTATLTVDNRRPTVAVTALDANATPASAPADRTVHTNGTLGVRVATNGTPGPVSNATVEVVAQFTTFRAAVSNASGVAGDWTAVGDLSGLPDDGNYSVNVSVVDPAHNPNATTANATVILDRAAPALGATVTRVNASTGRVTLSTSEPVRDGGPTVTVALPNGTTRQVGMAESGDNWTGTFPLAGDGTYDVTATARDRAGNAGTDAATATVTSVATTDNSTTVRLPTGTFVRFATAKETTSYVSLTGSDSPLASLPENLTGVRFLSGQLGSTLAANLEVATVGIPVNASPLPAGTSVENASIGFHNGTAAGWERLNTTVRNVTADGETDEYWLANGTHFPVYGVVAEDDAPPSLQDTSPAGDLAWGTTEATVRFEYADAASGVNASAVTLSVDGADVTGDPATTITSGYATHLATGLDAGTYDATLTVADEAGNSETFSTTFAVPADTAPPSILGTTPGEGHEFPAGTSSATLSVEYADDASGVDASAVTVSFDGVEVTGDPATTVDSTSVVYEASGLSDGTDHTLSVVVVDRAGRTTTVALPFSIATSGGGGGGGDGGAGGGGDGGGDPTVSQAIAEVVPDGVAIEVINGQPGATARTMLPATGAGPVTFDEFAADFAAPAGDFEVLLSPSAERPSSAPALDGATPLAFVTVEAGVPDATVDRATVAFSLSADDLPAGASLDDVVALRYHDGAWRGLDTERSDTRFRARTPGFSAFAIAVAETDIAVADASVGDREIAIGEEAIVTVTLSNDGRKAGSQRVEVTVDGAVAATREVEVPARDSATATLAWTPEAAGSYEVAVDGVDAGTLRVSARDGTTTATTATTTTTDPDPTTTTSPVEDDGGPGLVLVVGLLLVAVALVLGLRYLRRTGHLDGGEE